LGVVCSGGNRGSALRLVLGGAMNKKMRAFWKKNEAEKREGMGAPAGKASNRTKGSGVLGDVEKK